MAQTFRRNIYSLKDVLESVGLKFEKPTISQVDLDA